MFLPRLGQHEFIKTEALRAIVVQEMLERPGWTLPTVHHRPYLNKPPLYAWVTTTLARVLGHFDEGVARLPSAVAVSLLVVLLYGVGERWIGGGAGLASAAFALANVTVLDYGVRAELDIGFTFLTTAATVLAWPALRCRGVRSSAAWAGVYASATLAAMWKGPHSLIFLWLMLLFYGRVTRDWRWLRSPGQWLGLAAAAAVLVGWSVLLSANAGTATVGHTAGIELLERLVPYRPKHWLSILWFLPVLLVITLPASVFVLASLREGVVVPCGAADPSGSAPGTGFARLRGRLLLWWRAVSVEPFAMFLLCWLVPNAVFLAVAPAKAPRYALPLFPATCLWAAWVLYRVEVGQVAERGARHVTLAWRCIGSVIAVAGAVLLVLGVARFCLPGTLPGAVDVGHPMAWLATGVAWLAMGAGGLAPPWRSRLPRRALGLIVVALAGQVLVRDAWWPLRTRSDSQHDAAAGISSRLSPGEPVFVLGAHEFFDTAYYCTHPFYRLASPAEATRHWGGRTAHFLLREKDLARCLPPGDDRFHVVYRFSRAETPSVLVEGPVP